MRSSFCFCIFLSVLLLLNSCSTNPKFCYIIQGKDSSIKTTNISINDLSKESKKFHGQYIETEGKFSAGFEDFSINTKKDFFSSELIQFWMETNRDLNISEEDWQTIEKSQGSKVIVKGRIDTTRHGHLGQYLATISDIYYLKTK